jgi:hypothetical protein
MAFEKSTGATVSFGKSFKPSHSNSTLEKEHKA